MGTVPKDSLLTSRREHFSLPNVGCDMPDSSGILDALHGISSRLNEDMSEKDVENTFLNEDFYTLLGADSNRRPASLRAKPPALWLRIEGV